MSQTLDRFSTGVMPREPVEVGTCEGCGGVMYDYELRTCGACGCQVHEGCLEKCEICGRDGCKACLTQDPDTGERRCEENCEVTHDNSRAT